MTPLAPALAALVLAGVPAAQDRVSAAEVGPPERFVRLLESEEGRVLHLQVAVRRFTRAGSPEILLAGAIHVAQRSFYEALQHRLDALDLVLFESVKPAGTGRPEHDLAPPDDAMRVRITEGRIRFLAAAIERYRALAGALPADLDHLAERLPADVAALVERGLDDAWDRPLLFVAAPGRSGRDFDLQSLGADGKVGGRGVDADLCFSDQEDLSEVERGESGGIQADLAEALGLVFQLDAMSHVGENWRNSDLSIDQVEARLAEAGLDASELFDSMGGSSFLARAAGFALKLVSRFAYGNAVLKLMGIELLARADELMNQAPDELEELLRVLLVDRNRAVIADLKEALESSPDLKSIGILYGAAHMADLEQRITSELGYRRADETWSDAVTLDLDGLGIDPDRVRLLRRLIREGLDRQLGDR